MNVSHSVISEPKQLLSTKEELLQNFKDQNVTDVSRIILCRNEQVLPTKHIILTFNSPALSTRIEPPYTSSPVKTYMLNPPRCLKGSILVTPLIQ